MAFVISERTGEYTATTGTGTVTTSGTPQQAQTFSAGVGTGNTTSYMLLSGDGLNWEQGVATVTVSAGVTTLTRANIIASSQANAAISLVGTSYIFCTAAAAYINSQLNAGSSASPAGNVSTTEKMMGLGLVSGFSLTPKITGRVLIWIGGVALNSTLAGDGTTITGRFGTGTAPSNAAAVSGTAFGLPQHYVAATTLEQAGFIVMGSITGLTLGTAVWFDLSLLAVTGGGSTVKDVQIIVFEY